MNKMVVPVKASVYSCCKPLYAIEQYFKSTLEGIHIPSKTYEVFHRTAVWTILKQFPETRAHHRWSDCVTPL